MTSPIIVTTNNHILCESEKKTLIKTKMLKIDYYILHKMVDA